MGPGATGVQRLQAKRVERVEKGRESRRVVNLAAGERIWLWWWSTRG
jgi:hypothetical protein